MRMLWRALRHPRMQLYAFDARETLRREVARSTWGWLALFALAGTLFYGATLPRVSALQLLLATGLSWCLFGPALVAVTRRRVSTCAHACLVTMAYGIGVLALGAGINLLWAPRPLWIVLWVGLSNGVMAIAMVRQLEAVGVRAWRTFATWVDALDGTGVLLF